MKSDNNKILITGSAGFIGFHLSRQLLSKGYQIIGLDSLNEYYDVKLKIDRNKILQNIMIINSIKLILKITKRLRNLLLKLILQLLYIYRTGRS